CAREPFWGSWSGDAFDFW
nr:immunoglobulin heavy chain junction region [Macaca mulatta]MOW75931.1 immunoglobulin heavy chain junction region [Macaca mulatta]MOW76309.1 immunoglobulin heavy chain junction region [Macaca mulatta]MOW77081.1 immunoglobulin heavy chain junction region [Macaca mulatta]MOW77921.1 immunoglobulin heavy chain junction region [Macaca mulatta]